MVSFVPNLKNWTYTEGKKKNRPPAPKSQDLGPPRDGFFKQLLITNEIEKLGRQPSPSESVQSQSQKQPQIQRTGRLTQKRSNIVQRPSFNTFLKG